MNHEHTEQSMLPLWRSDLCGDGSAYPLSGLEGRWYSHCLPHGWWCPVCEAETPDPDAPQIGAIPRWEVRLLPDFKVSAKGPDPLDGAELAKFEAAIGAAGRQAKSRRARAIALGLGHVGWRITAENVVWYWSGPHARRGCSLVGIKPRLDCKCTVCQTAIEAGHSCWRGDGGVMGLHEMDDWRHVRVCARCIATLPREPFTSAAPAPAATGGRKVAPLRLVKEVVDANS